MRDWSRVTPRLWAEEDRVTEQPLKSTDKGKDKMDSRGLIKIISVLSSMSFSLFTLIQDFNLYTLWPRWYSWCAVYSHSLHKSTHNYTLTVLSSIANLIFAHFRVHSRFCFLLYYSLSLSPSHSFIDSILFAPSRRGQSAPLTLTQYLLLVRFSNGESSKTWRQDRASLRQNKQAAIMVCLCSY